MVKRFECVDVYEPGGASMGEAEDGAWVEYEDYEALALKLVRYREALECLLPGLILDLRYAEPDDDKDAMQSRINTVREALSDE